MLFILYFLVGLLVLMQVQKDFISIGGFFQTKLQWVFGILVWWVFPILYLSEYIRSKNDY